MKRTLWLPLIVISISLSACLVKSLHPFYTKEDIRFENTFVGNWMDQDSSFWDFRQYKTDASMFSKDSLYSAYRLSYSGEDGEKSNFYVTLFRLNGSLYFDFLPKDNLEDKELFTMHIIPVHTLAKVEKIDKNNFRIKWFNEDWLTGLIDSNQLEIAHEIITFSGDNSSGTPVLTANTEALQNFIISHADDPKAFDCDKGFCGDMVRVGE